MTAQQLLRDLGTRLGLPSLGESGQGRCAVRLGGDLAVSIEASDTLLEVLLSAHLGELPAAFGPEVLLRALLANTLLAQAGPLRLSWLPGTRQLALCMALRFDQLERRSLAGWLEELAQGARESRQDLQAHGLLADTTFPA
jgi:hypothetical protein